MYDVCQSWAPGRERTRTRGRGGTVGTLPFRAAGGAAGRTRQAARPAGRGRRPKGVKSENQGAWGARS